MKLPFLNWPFDEDEVVTLHWIASPIIERNGLKTCVVYFRKENGKLSSATAIWGCLPALWIGRKFANAKPLADSTPVKEITISTDRIYKLKYDTARLTIPRTLYALNYYRIFDEWCCSFEHNWYTYCIPCVELARAFLARNSVLANQLISSGGLDDLIDLSSWHVDGQAVTFDFLTDTPGISKAFAKTFAAIYGTPQLHDNWKYTYSRYIATGLIKTKLPTHAYVKLSYTETGNDKTRFVYAVEFINIKPLLREVHYGPEKTVHTGKNPEKEGIINLHLPSDECDLEITDTLAKRTQFSTEILSSSATFLDRMEATRKNNKDNSISKTRIIEQEDAEEAFSVGDISQVGQKPFINLEMRNVQFNNDPDFTSFCKAIRILGNYADITIIDVTFENLPQSKRISTLNMTPTRSRKYVSVLLQKGDKTWVIIELCNKDGYSISTLFTKCLGTKEELVNSIIDKLLISNGSWSRKYFPKNEYKTLDHHESRSPERWADLMYCKML